VCAVETHPPQLIRLAFIRLVTDAARPFSIPLAGQRERHATMYFGIDFVFVPTEPRMALGHAYITAESAISSAHKQAGQARGHILPLPFVRLLLPWAGTPQMLVYCTVFEILHLRVISLSGRRMGSDGQERNRTSPAQRSISAPPYVAHCTRKR
jgi:hypothetical protein